MLLVTDAGLVQVGHVARAVRSLENRSCFVELFAEVITNPTTSQVAAGVRQASKLRIDGIIALGGGSAMHDSWVQVEKRS